MSTIIPMPVPHEDQLTPCSYAVDVTEGDPQEREYVYLAAPDGSFTIGLWEAQPYAELITSYPGDELCHVVRGQVRLTDSDGTSRTFVTGDTFTVEAGWAGEWRVEQTFVKYFALSVKV
jgi:uncharacterized cupin superfamily protein